MADFTFHYKYQSPNNLNFRFWNGYLDYNYGAVSYTYKPGDVVAFYEKSNLDYLRIMTDYHDSSYWSSKTFYSNHELPGLEDFLVASDSVFNSFSMSFTNCTQGNAYQYFCPLNSSVESSQGLISSSTVNSAGGSVIQGGTSLFGIGLQLLPYLISLVVILIIWLVIKRISNLKHNPYK